MHAKPPVLVALYVKRFHRQVEIAAREPGAWIVATRRFGLNLMIVAAALLALCVVLPDDSRRWLFVGIAVVTGLAGAWHRKYARSIAELARQTDGKGENTP